MIESKDSGWHAQVTSVSLRHYEHDPERSFIAQLPYDATAQALLLTDKIAFVHTALNATGEPFTRAEWASLGILLRDKYGIESILADRNGELITIRVPKKKGLPLQPT